MSKNHGAIPAPAVAPAKTLEQIDGEFWQAILTVCEKYQRDIMSVPALAPAPGLSSMFYITTRLAVKRRDNPA